MDPAWPNERPIDHWTISLNMELLRTALQSNKARLRAGSKLMYHTETGDITNVPTIEVKLPRQPKYIPLTMPDGRWYFDSVEQRDRALEALAPPNDA